MAISAEALGLILACIAGSATMLGACVVFCVDRFKPWMYSMGVACAAGVMIYVSLVELLGEGAAGIEEGLLDAEWDETKAAPYAYLFATLSFVVGWIATSIMDLLLHWCSCFENAGQAELHDLSQSMRRLLCRCNSSKTNQVAVDEDTGKTPAASVSSGSFHDGSEVAAAAEVLNTEEEDAGMSTSQLSAGETSHRRAADSVKTTEERLSSTSFQIRPRTSVEEFLDDQEAFKKVGLFTGVAMALHNFPEGIITYTSTVANPKFGVAVTVAIAIHNIPEGMAVAIPIFYGNGSKCKAFGYSALAGMAEPLGAFFAFLVIKEDPNRIGLGIVLAFSGGIMANVSFVELLPSALKFDPNNRVSSLSLFGGILIMAASLVLLEFFL